MAENAPTPHPSQVNTASAWVPSDFPISATWSFDLSETERATLINLGQGRSNSAGVDELTAKASGWARMLSNGPGFLRVRKFPVDELSVVELERAFVELGRLIGTPVGQDRNGSLITHIRDERLPPGPGVRRYQTNLSQGFHSDASDIVGLLCIQAAKSGGMSRIVSAHTIYNEFARHAPLLLELLYEPMPWSRHTEQREGETPYFELAPISDVNGVPRISVIPWFIRQSQEHPAAPRLTEPQLAALDLFDSLTSLPDFQVTMQFERGDLQWLNNTCILHARDAYVDHKQLEQRRHMARVWLTAEVPIAEEILRGGKS